MHTAKWTTELIDGLRSELADDIFWREELKRAAEVDSNIGIHIGIFVKPYLDLLLGGKKTVESRFSANRCAPYGIARKADVLLLKRSGGPIMGLCRLGDVWCYQLEPQSWRLIRDRFAEQLCISDPAFWAAKKDACYATLMRVEHSRQVEPVAIPKRDRRGWVVVRGHQVQQDLIAVSGLDGSVASPCTAR